MAEFTGPDDGKTTRYVLRWLGTQGEVGAWSETAGAAIRA